MRRLFMALGLIVICPAVWAQTPATMHASDGGVRERLQSLTIPPQANAPFLATVTTEWTKLLPDGSKQSNWNRRTIARDSSGRIFQERRFFTPDGDKVPTPLSELDYADSHRHEVYACKPQERMCYVYPYSVPESVSLLPAGPLPNGRGTVAREELGQQTIDGVEAIGSREITTLNAKANGMEKSEPIVKEFWYSSLLGINVVTKRFDPRTGGQNIAVSGINQAEPDPKLFEPPTGYRVVKMESMGGTQ